MHVHDMFNLTNMNEKIRDLITPIYQEDESPARIAGN